MKIIVFVTYSLVLMEPTPPSISTLSCSKCQRLFPKWQLDLWQGICGECRYKSQKSVCKKCLHHYDETYNGYCIDCFEAACPLCKRSMGYWQWDYYPYCSFCSTLQCDKCREFFDASYMEQDLLCFTCYHGLSVDQRPAKGACKNCQTEVAKIPLETRNGYCFRCYQKSRL
jgi:hypothetical protein